MDHGAKDRPYSTPDDLSETDPVSDIGTPGAFPFTRGIQPDMYRGRPWTMRQYAGFGTALSPTADIATCSHKG
jgi:methylmalonyl-CoA mutase N-terminal domain/subunit